MFPNATHLSYRIHSLPQHHHHHQHINLHQSTTLTYARNQHTHPHSSRKPETPIPSSRTNLARHSNHLQSPGTPTQLIVPASYRSLLPPRETLTAPQPTSQRQQGPGAAGDGSPDGGVRASPVGNTGVVEHHETVSDLRLIEAGVKAWGFVGWEGFWSGFLGKLRSGCLFVKNGKDGS